MAPGARARNDAAPPTRSLGAVSPLSRPHPRKAHSAGIWHDEAYTFFTYVNRPVEEILFFAEHYDANNHPLNTLLIKVFVALLGSAEPVLRLPNLLASGFFYWGVVAWFKDHKAEIWLAAPLLFQPLIWDFFAMARGYGLALAALIWTLVFFQRYLDSRRTRTLHLSLLSALLMVEANFSFLTAYLAFLCSVVLFTADHDDKKKAWMITGGWLLLTFLLLVRPIHILRTHGELYYGTRGKLLYSALYNFVGTTYYQRDASPWTMEQWTWFLGIVVGLSVMAPLLGFWSCREWRKTTVLPLLLLLLGLLGNWLQHVLFGTPYPFNRTALAYLPLLILPLAGWGSRPLFKAAGILSLGICGLHGMRVYSPVTFPEWAYDAYTRGGYELYLERRAAGEGLSFSWILEPSLNYYRFRRAPAEPAYSIGPVDPEADWLLLLPEDRLPKTGRQLVKEFPNGLTLWH